MGQNSDGNYLEKAGKVMFHYVFEPAKVVMYIEKDPKSKQVSPVPGVTIKEISCGSNHTIAIDDKFRVSKNKTVKAIRKILLEKVTRTCAYHIMAGHI